MSVQMGLGAGGRSQLGICARGWGQHAHMPFIRSVCDPALALNFLVGEPQIRNPRLDGNATPVDVVDFDGPVPPAQEEECVGRGRLDATAQSISSVLLRTSRARATHVMTERSL